MILVFLLLFPEEHNNGARALAPNFYTYVRNPDKNE